MLHNMFFKIFATKFNILNLCTKHWLYLELLYIHIVSNNRWLVLLSVAWWLTYSIMFSIVWFGNCIILYIFIQWYTCTYHSIAWMNQSSNMIVSVVWLYSISVTHYIVVYQHGTQSIELSSCILAYIGCLRCSGSWLF